MKASDLRNKATNGGLLIKSDAMKSYQSSTGVSSSLQAYPPPQPQRAFTNTNVVRSSATKVHDEDPNHQPRHPEIAVVLGIVRVPLEATLLSPVSAATTPRTFKRQMQLGRILTSHYNVSEKHAKNVDRGDRGVTMGDHAGHVRNEGCLAVGGVPHQLLPTRQPRSKPQPFKR